MAFKKQTTELAAELESTAATAAAKRKVLEPVQANVTGIESAITTRAAQIKQMADAMAKLKTEFEGLNQAQTADQRKLDESRSKLKELEADAEQAEDAAQKTKDKADFFRSVYGA